MDHYMQDLTASHGCKSPQAPVSVHYSIIKHYHPAAGYRGPPFLPCIEAKPISITFERVCMLHTLDLFIKPRPPHCVLLLITIVFFRIRL